MKTIKNKKLSCVVVDKFSDKNGRELVTIKNFKNVRTLDTLPLEYLSEEPFFYLKSDCCINLVTKGRQIAISIGDVVQKDKFNYYIELMKEAGSRLLEINCRTHDIEVFI